MPHPKESHEKHDSSKSRLKSLQAALAKYKENFKNQDNRFKQLAIEARKLEPRNQNTPKPPTLTFKKSKLQQSSQSIHNKT